MLRSKATGKIGVFDSGIGGLIILKALHTKLPKYDYEYYGDTKNLPYGSKSQSEIFDLTIKGIKYLQARGCELIILACNTASAKALRKIQQQWLPKHAPDLKVLGVVVPTMEFLAKTDFPAVLIATKSAVNSEVYQKELKKLFPTQRLTSLALPELVNYIESGQVDRAITYATKLISPVAKKNKSLILGCTHYPLIASELSEAFPKLNIIDQSEIIPLALYGYLKRHQIIEKELSKKGKVHIHFTKENAINKKLARTWF